MGERKKESSKSGFSGVVDSTGLIQVVGSVENIGIETFDLFSKVNYEAAIEIEGFVVEGKGVKEIEVKKFKIIGETTKQFSPRPRSDFDIFDSSLTDHLLRNRHVYIRNPKIMAILKFRHILMNHTRNWFNQNDFTEIDAPILTPIPLYEDGSAMKINVHNEEVFLTQCVGYYLEAAVHAFERVYNMGPSFRG